MKQYVGKDSKLFEQWRLGDWEKIADNTSDFYSQVAAAFQLKTVEEARKIWSELEHEEYDPTSLEKILIASVYNNLGKASLLLDDWDRAERNYSLMLDHLESEKYCEELSNEEKANLSAKIGGEVYSLERFPVTVNLNIEKTLQDRLDMVSWAHRQLSQLYPEVSSSKVGSIRSETKRKYDLKKSTVNLLNIEPQPLAEEPKLTFPDEVSSYVEKIYKKANVILEYGSGGSTVLAAKMPNKKIISVENDVQWATNINNFFEKANFPSRPEIFAVDVGETGKWAKPKDDKKWRKFSNYPLAVWCSENFSSPDVILIDGRFRVACFITAVLSVKKPTIVLFDDYTNREYYHIVERLYVPTKKIGRMARFDISPREWPREYLAWMVESYSWVTYESDR